MSKKVMQSKPWVCCCCIKRLELEEAAIKKDEMEEAMSYDKRRKELSRPQILKVDSPQVHGLFHRRVHDFGLLRGFPNIPSTCDAGCFFWWEALVVSRPGGEWVVTTLQCRPSLSPFPSPRPSRVGLIHPWCPTTPLVSLHKFIQLGLCGATHNRWRCRWKFDLIAITENSDKKISWEN